MTCTPSTNRKFLVSALGVTGLETTDGGGIGGVAVTGGLLFGIDALIPSEPRKILNIVLSFG